MAAGAPLAMLRSNCLRLRLHASPCTACADACPVHAIEVGPQSLALRSGCTGCGRCQVACPTAALAVAGFDDVGPSTMPRGGVLEVECWRVSGEASDGATLRVPCLGGIAPGQLAQWCADAGERTLVLVDRGLCAGCDSGGVAVHPAHAMLQSLIPLLREAGMPPARLPRIERRDGPAGATHRAAVDPMSSRGRARRGFFGALARPAAAPLRAAPGRGSATTRERHRLLAALRVLAKRQSGRLPAALFAGLEVGPGCRNDRVCAATCPTGALQRYRDELAARIGISFDTEDCIACGHCVDTCPERALTLRHGAGQASRRALTRFVQRECLDCGSLFAVPDGEDPVRCDRCRKSAQLACTAFHSLFSARP